MPCSRRRRGRRRSYGATILDIVKLHVTRDRTGSGWGGSSRRNCNIGREEGRGETPYSPRVYPLLVRLQRPSLSLQLPPPPPCPTHAPQTPYSLISILPSSFIRPRKNRPPLVRSGGIVRASSTTNAAAVRCDDRVRRAGEAGVVEEFFRGDRSENILRNCNRYHTLKSLIINSLTTS
jgi:hypothetical protein